ncbi:MAG: phosphate acetyltransferase [Candidatus Gracilibacteria bacterium]|nr:phosphate acetyltransferase [Candidatus Gracilibacteria bacterium]
MKQFINRVEALARKNPKHIIFPEGNEPRMLQATEEILKKKMAKITLLGNEEEIKNLAKKLKLKIDWEKVMIIDPMKSPLRKKYAKAYYELRKHKGVTERQASEVMKQSHYFGTMMIHLDDNDTDGMVLGTQHPTAESIRPALEIVKTKEKFHKISGIFFMVFKRRVILFADAAITIDPNAHDLVDIATDTAETAKRFGIEPKVAMLSFSTKGSAKHPFIDKVREAVAMIKYEKPDLIVDGELQVDAAIVPEVAERKCPDSPVKGEANVLIFPDLEAANIAYKLVERLAKAKAIGPILQGLKRPINKVSRGCSYQDIVNVTAFTVCECYEG